MFQLENVKFKHILDIPKLTINEGITCLIGASGAGKTTLLKLLNKLYSPDSGKIYYQGKNMETIDSVTHRREVIMLGQNPIIYEGSVEDNLQMGLRFSHRTDASQQELKKVLKQVQLDKPMNASCAGLSGGEKQRLCLARIMLMDGEVYLLDEPSSALDQESEAFLIQCLSNFVLKRNKSMIMVTHSMHAVDLLDAHKIRIAKGNSEVIV
ncbi:ABC transporter ATP-binding protein [Copranaerobaculum intestinale]|nr:ATP-binding cassette domain-containing protein [Copranaerobaculum intestinale]